MTNLDIEANFSCGGCLALIGIVTIIVLIAANI